MDGWIDMKVWDNKSKRMKGMDGWIDKKVWENKSKPI
jgi:hypothetical protein